jgi:hypothetical protein
VKSFSFLKTKKLMNFFSLLMQSRGKYSIERLKSFEKYRETSHWAWMVLVIFAVPFPCLIIFSSLNFIPLAKPEDGWEANWVYFLRTTFTM